MEEVGGRLTNFPVLMTNNLEEARDAVERIYLPHDLTSRDNALDMTLNAVEDKILTLGFLTYGSEAKLVMPPTEDSYHINLTTKGNTLADRQDGQRARTGPRTGGTALRPDQTNTVRWTADAEQLILKISRKKLECHLSDLLARPINNVVDFDLNFDLTSPSGQTFLASVEFLARELDRPGGLSEMPVARQQLEAFIMTQLLQTIPHSYRDQLQGPCETVGPGRLKTIVKYMKDHAGEPITPADLARVGCMSVRTLYGSFQEVFGVSPMCYLRQIRLDSVREDLLKGDSEEARIGYLAMRWGFYHLSRFAQQYRDRFGELPSETVRRHLA